MLLSILPNWTELSLLQQIYWVVAIPATLIFLIILLATVVGSDVDAEIDTDIDSILADGDSIPFQFLSLKNIVGFFTMFGWSGLGFIELGWPHFQVIAVSALCGLLMMLAMATIFYLMSRLVENGTLNLKNAIGKVGEVYLLIPARKGGLGKVQITIQGTLQTLDAMTEEEEPIETGSIVLVQRIIDDQILVVKRNL